MKLQKSATQKLECWKGENEFRFVKEVDTSQEVVPSDLFVKVEKYITNVYFGYKCDESIIQSVISLLEKYPNSEKINKWKLNIHNGKIKKKKI